MHHHVRRMPNVAHHLRQPVQVMEPHAVALKGGQVLGPRRKNQQRPVCTGLKPTALWLPVSPDGVDLQVNQSQPLFKRHVLYPLLTFGDARSYQHVPASCRRQQSLTFRTPERGVFGGHTIRATMKEHPVFFGLSNRSMLPKAPKRTPPMVMHRKHLNKSRYSRRIM